MLLNDLNIQNLEEILEGDDGMDLTGYSFYASGWNDNTTTLASGYNYVIFPSGYAHNAHLYKGTSAKNANTLYIFQTYATESGLSSLKYMKITGDGNMCTQYCTVFRKARA